MGIEAWSTTPANNNSAPPNGAPDGMAPSTVNDTMRQQMADHRSQWNDAQWFRYGDGDGAATTTYVAATQFKVAGADVTAHYHVGRRVKAQGSSTGTIYGTITAVSFSTDTTVTVAWDNVTQLQRLHNGAIWQEYRRLLVVVDEIEKRLPGFLDGVQDRLKAEALPALPLEPRPKRGLVERLFGGGEE